MWVISCDCMELQVRITCCAVLSYKQKTGTGEWAAAGHTAERKGEAAPKLASVYFSHTCHTKKNGLFTDFSSATSHGLHITRWKLFMWLITQSIECTFTVIHFMTPEDHGIKTQSFFVNVLLSIFIHEIVLCQRPHLTHT